MGEEPSERHLRAIARPAAQLPPSSWPEANPDREIAALDIGRADLRRHAVYHIAGYGYYLCRRIAARGFGYGKMSYVVRFGDRAVGDAISEGRTDRRQITVS
jgi:hypothetical protein